ncbi:hypothetical protein BKA66DRAFT_572354 [Pyrenochaeta sp. MPI-SDFR-AT-0127]|nr:hypothetical protein BKA66DRAFT_572354 [Pyrenochaeta sp. MPI-SDFR-AT-0127]
MSSTTIPTTPTKAKILLTGLNVQADIPDYFRTLYGTPQEIKAKIDADTQRIREFGYDVTLYYMDDQNPLAGLDWLAAALRAESFKGIMVGSGLRLVPPQTELFEKVVDVCRRESPGSIFMFNYGPGTNFETLERNQERLG